MSFSMLPGGRGKRKKKNVPSEKGGKKGKREKNCKGGGGAGTLPVMGRRKKEGA